MANNLTNTANIGGGYSGTVSMSGTVMMGRNISTGGGNIPVVVMGDRTSAGQNASNSIVGGVLARSESPSSFVWNGSYYHNGDPASPVYTETSPYMGASDSKNGTFSINPENNTDGFYIGTKSLKSHMDSLSGFIANSLSSSEFTNNIVHKDGDETISGKKTFSSVTTFGTGNQKSTINSSSINISSSNGDGGILFNYDGAQTPTSKIREIESGKIEFDSNIKATKSTEFISSLNTFNGITLSSNATSDFRDGEAFAKTQSYSVGDHGDEKIATTEYVIGAIESAATSGMSTKDNTFEGTTTFANTVSLSSSSVIGGSVTVDLTAGNVYVADRAGNVSSSLAANTKFVQNIAASLSASLRGNKLSIGSNIVPIFLNGTSSANCSLVQSSANVGSSIKPMYMTGGSLTAMSASIGGLNQPVYLNDGNIAACNTLVSTSTEQTIDGRKSFSSISSININGNIYINDLGITKGNKPSSKHYKGIFIRSSNFTKQYSSCMMAGFEEMVDTDGSNTLVIGAYQNQQGTTATSGIKFVISQDGKLRYASIGNPTKEDGSIYESKLTIDGRLPNIGWCNTYFARKDGATFSGDVTLNTTSHIVASSRSTTWVTGRDAAVIKTTNAANGYYPMMSVKSVNGSWDIGTYTNNVLHFSYISDDNYNTKNNVRTTSFEFPTDANSNNLKLGSVNAGSSLTPVYLSSGKFTACNSVVHVNGDETIVGSKRFASQLSACGGGSGDGYSSLLVYNSTFSKGNISSASEKNTTGIEFVEQSAIDGSKNGKRLGLIRSQFDINGSSLGIFTYKNETNSTANATMGVFMSTDAKTSYGYAPTPPSSFNTSENRIATTGWTNSYFARKDRTETFSSAVTVNGLITANRGITVKNGVVELYGNTPFIDFHHGNTTTDYSGRIIQDASGHMRICPGTQADTAASIQLGTQTIGSTSSPVYVNGGHITECGHKPCGSFTLCGHANQMWFRPTNIVVPGSKPSSIYIVVRNDGAKATFQLGSSTNQEIAASGKVLTYSWKYSDYASSSIRIKLSRAANLWMNILVY